MVTREEIYDVVNRARDSSYVEINHHLMHESFGWIDDSVLAWVEWPGSSISERTKIFYGHKRNIIVHLGARFHRGQWRILTNNTPCREVIAEGIGLTPFIEALENANP